MPCAQAVAGPHCPVAEHVCTPPLPHWVLPGAHVPVQAPVTQAWPAHAPAPTQYGVAVAHGTGDDQTPASVHARTSSCSHVAAPATHSGPASECPASPAASAT